MIWLAIVTICITATQDCRPLTVPVQWLSEERCQSIAALEAGRYTARLSRVADPSSFSVTTACRPQVPQIAGTPEDKS